MSGWEMVIDQVTALAAVYGIEHEPVTGPEGVCELWSRIMVASHLTEQRRVDELLNGLQDEEGELRTRLHHALKNLRVATRMSGTLRAERDDLKATVADLQHRLDDTDELLDSVEDHLELLQASETEGRAMSQRMWSVRVNGSWETIVAAETAADASEAGCNEWRMQHTRGRDLGLIDCVDVHLIRESQE